MNILSEKFEIKCTCFSHNIGIGGLIQRYFADKNVKNVMGIIGSGPIRKYSKFDGIRNPFSGSIPKKDIIRIVNNNSIKNKIISLADQYLFDRLNGNINHLDAKKAFAADNFNYSNSSEFCNSYDLDPNKKSVFVMLHAFNDYPNIFECIHMDYFLWLENVLKIALKNTEVNWIFKEHPSSEFYPTEDVNLKQYFEKNSIGAKHIRFIGYQEKFNSQCLKNIAHAIVTVVGTAALEFACFGIPSIICGKNHFAEFEICKRAKSTEELEQMLISISDLQPVNKEQCELARIVYYLHFGVVMANNWNSNAFLPVSNHEDRLKNEIQPVIDYYNSYLNTEDCSDYLNRIKNFLTNDEEIIFFRDPELASIQTDK